MDRERLLEFLTAIGATARLERDGCGDFFIPTRWGHIYRDGTGYLVFFSFTGHPRRWNNMKRRLGGFRVTQDGDDEGCIHIDTLDYLPPNGLRKCVGLRKRGKSNPDAANHLRKYRFGNA
jgi:hypothetical protein